MASLASSSASTLGLKIDRTLEVKFQLLEALISSFQKAKSVSDTDLDVSIKRAREEFLIGKFGCSEEVADRYIAQAKSRLS